jgi:DNA-binding transcriptional LysR family regulator
MFMQSLDLDSLRSFVAVVESASFSRAGEIVGRTQSAISLQMAKLERRLGKTLLERCQGRLLGLTEDGRELLPFARRMIDLNDAACRAIAQGAVAGRVRLGVPADFMDADFPEVLRAFQHGWGGIEVTVVSDVSQRLQDQVAQGQLDLAFFKRPMGNHRQGETILRQNLTWAGGPSTVLAAPDEPLPLVLFPDGCMFRAQALASLEKAGRCWRLAYVCPSLESVRMAVRSGLGVGVLPRGSAMRDLEDLSSQDLPPLAEVEIATMIGRDGGRAARLLADHISRHIRKAL